MFANAKQAEIIRSNQKDEYYAGYIKSSLADIVQTVLGPRTWLQWRQELSLLAELGYFGLTTLAGYQTLGEEYVNIIQVDNTLRAIPSRWRRALMVSLQISVPYLIDRGLGYIEKHILMNPEVQLSPQAKTAILNAIPVIRHTVTILHRCHLALFYMKGVFYHIAKRFTHAHYILVRDAGGPGSAGSDYRILGWLSIIQLAFTFLQHLYKWTIRQRAQSKDAKIILGQNLLETHAATTAHSQDASESLSDPSLKCVLCLEARTRSTCTPCGHLFCWHCITEWCSNKAECPLCREAFDMSRLVCLQNYDPS